MNIINFILYYYSILKKNIIIFLDIKISSCIILKFHNYQNKPKMFEIFIYIVYEYYFMAYFIIYT